MEVPKPLSMVRALITDDKGTVLASHNFSLIGPQATKLPFSFGVLAPEDDLDSAVIVEVSALETATASQSLFTRRAVSRFVPNKSLRLPMYLPSACHGLVCGEEQTCTENGCQSVFVEPSTLQESTDSPGDLVIKVNTRASDAGIIEDSGVSMDAEPTDSGIAPGSVRMQTTPVAMTWVYSGPASLYFNQTEVTVAQYEACVTVGACTSSNHSTGGSCNYGNTSRSNHPMNCVSWHGATEFCTWVGARLPTEDEWYAEASNNDTRTYPWGDTPQASCTHCVMDNSAAGGAGCGNNSTMPVGSKPLGDSVSGLSDLSGNVWEWTITQSGSSQIHRGGAWDFNGQPYFRTSARYMDSPDHTGNSVGFRCVSDTAP